MKQYLGYTWLLLLLVSCSADKKEKTITQSTAKDVVELSASQAKNADIHLTTLLSKSFSSTLHLTGKVEAPPQNNVSITVPVNGYIRQIRLEPGMMVQKGELLLYMECPDLVQWQQEYLTTKAKNEYLSKEVERQKVLNQSKATSDKMLQQTMMEYHSNLAQMNAVGERLRLAGLRTAQLQHTNIQSRIAIHSPVTGYVTSVFQNRGKYVTATEVVAEIIDVSDVHLTVTAFENDLPKLSIGQTVTAYTNTNPSQKVEAEIYLLGKELRPDRSTEIHCHFLASARQAVPGTFFNVEAKGTPRQVQVLPEEAIVRAGGKEHVFVVAGTNRFQLVPVSIGGVEGGLAEILNPAGLMDRKIVAKGAYTLLMAMMNKEEE